MSTHTNVCVWACMRACVCNKEREINSMCMSDLYLCVCVAQKAKTWVKALLKCFLQAKCFLRTGKGLNTGDEVKWLSLTAHSPHPPALYAALTSLPTSVRIKSVALKSISLHATETLSDSTEPIVDFPGRRKKRTENHELSVLQPSTRSSNHSAFESEGWDI